eukprot:3099060-Amphidinium_carterae.1
MTTLLTLLKEVGVEDAQLKAHHKVTAAVSCHGEALQFASEELRRDRDIVLSAVSQHGPLQLLSQEYQLCHLTELELQNGWKRPQLRGSGKSVSAPTRLRVCRGSLKKFPPS